MTKNNVSCFLDEDIREMFDDSNCVITDLDTIINNDAMMGKCTDSVRKYVKRRKKQVTCFETLAQVQ